MSVFPHFFSTEAFRQPETKSEFEAVKNNQIVSLSYNSDASNRNYLGFVIWYKKIKGVQRMLFCYCYLSASFVIQQVELWGKLNSKTNFKSNWRRDQIY